MRNEATWTESKFNRDSQGYWRGSRTELPVSSRVIGDCIAVAYQRAIDTYAKGRLVDLGCGKVPLYGMYRGRVTEVLCVDWPGSLHGADHVDLFADLNEPLDLASASFDTVIATDVIEHLYNPFTFFKSASRILTSGGALIIGVPFLYWVHEAPHDYFRYTRFALERLVTDVGLSVALLEPYGGPAEVLCDFATKSASRVAGLAWPVYALTRAFLALPPVRRRSRVKREEMPMGYILVATKGEVVRTFEDVACPT